MTSNKWKILTILLFIIFIILISFIIRFPYMYSSHERGSDSFFYHREVNVLITFHRWTWFLHPLSLWGLYPYSDSPGSPFLVADISLLTGLTVESSIILYDYLLVTIGILGAFLLGLKIKRSYTFALFVAIALSLAPKAVYPTIFSLDERVALVLMMPLWFLLIYYLIEEKKKYPSSAHRIFFLFIFLIYSFVLSTIHLIFFFSLAFFIAFGIFKLIIFYKNKHHISPLKPIWRIIMIFSIFLILFYSMFILSSFINIPGFNIDLYEKTAIFKGTSPLIIALNIIVSITGGAGILFLIFGLLGSFILVYQKNLSKFELFFILSLLLVTPFLINRLYIRPFLVSLISILVAYGAIHSIKKLSYTTRHQNRKYKQAFIAITIVSILVSAAFTGYMIHRWDSQYLETASNIPRKLTVEDYTVGIWMSSHMKLYDIYISNNEVVGGRVEAYANRIMMPGLYHSDLDNLVFYLLYKNKSELGIKFNSIFSKKIFTNKEKWREFALTYVYIMRENYKNTIHYLKEYNVSYFLYFKYRGATWSGWFDQHLYPSKFSVTASAYNYKLYINEWYDLIYLNYE